MRYFKLTIFYLAVFGKWINVYIINIYILYVLGDCTVLQCDEVCLQDVAQHTCMVEDNLLRWSVPNLMNLGDPQELFITNSQQNQTFDIFTAVLSSYHMYNGTQLLISTLSFIAKDQLNNKQIQCTGGGNTKTCNIMILGKSYSLYVIVSLENVFH